jgi:type III pantothenate kinase
MILTVDIGNSNVTLGGFSGDEISFVARISTDSTATEDDYACRILNILSLYNIDKAIIDGAIISSVVPQLNGIISGAIKKIASIDALLVGPGIKTGIKIQCDNPASVGADLICASVAVHFIYGTPALIVDMGTATKITFVDRSGAFIGTSIMPGVYMGLSALSEKTAQLPKVSLDAPCSIIAKNTADCMKSGVIFGNASMVDGMIERIKSETKENVSVYLTGGGANLIYPHCKSKMILDEHLALKGLNIIYKRNK